MPACLAVLLLCGCSDTSTPTSTAWDHATVRDDRTIDIGYERSSGRGCGEAKRADVTYREASVVVRLLVDLSADICAANAVPDTFTVRLTEPLNGREVLDPYDG